VLIPRHQPGALGRSAWPRAAALCPLPARKPHPPADV